MCNSEISFRVAMCEPSSQRSAQHCQRSDVPQLIVSFNKDFSLRACVNVNIYHSRSTWLCPVAWFSYCWFPATCMVTGTITVWELKHTGTHNSHQREKLLKLYQASYYTWWEENEGGHDSDFIIIYQWHSFFETCIVDVQAPTSHFINIMP